MSRKIKGAQLARAAGMVALLLTPALLPAQSVGPNPGGVLRDLERRLPTKAESASEGPRIDSSAPSGSPAVADAQRLTVSGYRIRGNSAFDESTLQAVVATRTGSMSLTELNAVVDAVTAYYRAHGYPLARAYLPRQQIENGVVSIYVLEGRYDRIDTHNTSRISDQRVTRTIESAVCEEGVLCRDSLIGRRALERGLLLLNDTPGAQASARLSPGVAVGTSALSIDAIAEPLAAGAMQLDNAGNYYTGVARAIGTLWVNSPAHLGDQFTVQGVASDIHGNLYYGALGYDLPLGYSGLRFGARASYLDYDLGEQYRDLDAHGRVRTADASVSYPFVRLRNANLVGRVTYGERRFHDFADALEVRTERRIGSRTELSLDGNLRDELVGAPAVNTLSVLYTSGHLHLDSALNAVDVLSARTAGRYGKWGASFSRLQQVVPRTSVYVRVTAQGGGENLDSYEKFALGGPDSVRAYPAGDTLADEAVLSTLELRQAFGAFSASALEGIVFYDHASGRLNSSPWAGTANHATLSGVGLGLNWSFSQRMILRSMVAFRGDRRVTAAPDHPCQFGLTLNTTF